MVQERSLPRPQETATCSCPEPDQPNVRPPTLISSKIWSALILAPTSRYHERFPARSNLAKKAFRYLASPRPPTC